MTEHLPPSLQAIVADPLAGYATLAAIVLALAAWSGGLLRGDVRALRRPRAWATLIIAVLVATGAAAALTVAGLSDDPRWATLVRAPAFLVAIVLGPSPGVLAAAAIAPIDPATRSVPATALTSLLETALIGWLALAPDPRRRRGAAGVAVVGGAVLATVSVGLATAAIERPGAAPWTLLATFRAPFLAVVTFGAAVALVPPRLWRRTARLAGSTLRDEREPEPLVVAPLRRSRQRPMRRLDAPAMPEPLARPLALQELPIGSTRVLPEDAERP
ncbi:MAG: hypothetical protein WD336_01430 [Trueperaceae bacterium]